MALRDGASSNSGQSLGGSARGGDDSGRSGWGCSTCDSAANGVEVGARRATRQRAGEVEDEGVEGVAVDEGFRQGLDTGEVVGAPMRKRGRSVSAWTMISESTKRAGSSGYLMRASRLSHRRRRG
jgi:hypothetical protein